MRHALFALLAFTSPIAFGQQSISQANALAGGITPGDAPGFPVTISVAGSYRLGSNLTPPSAVTAIDITADNVTLDLNGFSVIGYAMCDRGTQYGPQCRTRDFGTGIVSVGDLTVIKNGSVRKFSTGIAFNGAGTVVKNMGFKFNNFTAIDIGGLGAIVDNNRFIQNENATYALAGMTLAKDIISIHNGQGGLEIDTGTVEGVVTAFNGRYGIKSRQGSVIKTVKTSGNGEEGLLAFAGYSLVRDVNAVANVGAGINAGTLVDPQRTSTIVSSMSVANGDNGIKLTANSCFWQIAGQNNTPGNLQGGGTFDSYMTCFNK